MTTGIGLISYVNGNLVDRFKGIARSSSSGSLGLGGSSSVSISSALRVGAQTYATAVQALSATAYVVKRSQEILTK